MVDICKKDALLGLKWSLQLILIMWRLRRNVWLNRNLFVGYSSFKYLRILSKQVNEIRPFLVISILAGSLYIFTYSELSYVNAQNMTNSNTTRASMFNATGDGNMTSGNETTSNAQTASELREGDNRGRIAEAPNKCLGSALCPDW